MGLKTKLGARMTTVIWLVTLSAVFVELVGTVVDRTRVPTADDWRQAADFVRERFATRDLLVSAPDYTDPLLRWAAGDLVTFEQAGRSDVVGFEHLWALSVDGHRPSEAPSWPPDLEAQFGRVRVSRWPLKSTLGRAVSRPFEDLVARVSDATVSLAGMPCRFIESSVHGGGLGAGPLAPRRRFVCDPRRPWLWVGETVIEDLELKPRRCVAQHPAGPEPLRVQIPEVTLADRLVFYGGVYYEHERSRVGEEIHVAIFLGEDRAADLVHRDGDGWSRTELDTRARAGEKTTLTIETSTADPLQRSFCWAAFVRGESP